MNGPAGERPGLVVLGPGDRPVEAGRVDDVGVGRVDGVIRALAARGVLELLGRDLSRPRAEVDLAAEAAVVLHRAVDLERRRHVVVEVEELADGDLVLEIPPALALVVGHGHALVEALDEVIRVGRVDPQGVIVAARAADGLEGLAAVGRDAEGHAHDVDGVLVVGIDPDLAEDPAVGAGVAFHEGLLLRGQAARLASRSPRRRRSGRPWPP